MRLFAYRLCLALGGMTVAELLERISSAELTEWMAFYQIEPFGGAQDEYRAALVSSMLANTVRDPKKRKRAFEPAEFMRPQFVNEPEKQQPDQQELDQKILTIFGAMAAGGSNGIKNRNTASGGASHPGGDKTPPAG